MNSKECSVCKAVKPLDDFYKQNRKSKSRGEYVYYNPECKQCTKARSNEWQYENYDQSMISKRKYFKSEEGKSKEKVRNRRKREKGYPKLYYENNKEKFQTYRANREPKNHIISEAEWDSCKLYFNYRCAYCDLKIEDHSSKRNGKLIWTDFHREHVEDKGANDLSNCIPSCKSCNSQKWEFDFEEWYKEDNPVFSLNRKTKILNWLEKDYKQYINK